MGPIRRRDFIRTSAVAAGTVLPGVRAHSAAAAGSAAVRLPPPVGAGSTAPVRPFPLRSVRLGASVFQEKRDRMKTFVREFDERRFLVLFNDNAGRPNPPGVPVVGGWEDGGQLSGHWTGFYLTSLAQAYADEGEQVYRDKSDWMVDELAAVQDAITARMDGGGAGPGTGAGWVPSHAGYLGALPDDLVLRLGPPRFAIYGGDNGTWAPWYTQHKIMRGLLDVHYATGNATALAVVRRMADWARLALTLGDVNNPGYQGPVTRGDLNLMWDTYIAGEFNAANEPLAELYALTGDTTYLETAKLFDNRQSLFDACVRNEDILTVAHEDNPGPRRPDRLHANQHIPNSLGYLRIFEQTGEDEYLRAAKNFVGMVVPHRMYAIGGTGGSHPGSNSNDEQFQNRGNIANAITHSGSETEATHSLVKLVRNLFFHEPDAAHMDYYERAVVNQILGSRMDADSTGDPLITYFQSLAPGATRDFGNLGTGDGGAGLEDQTKYQESVYAHSADGRTLWVNLYIASTLDWAERGFTVTQRTDFPRADTTRLTVEGSGRLDIKLRVPAWAHEGFTVRINGGRPQTTSRPGTYLTLSRTWRRGDRIDISMPFGLRTERAADRPDTQAVFWGPLLMSILGDPGDGAYRELTLYRDLKRDGSYARAAITPGEPTAAGDPTFTCQGLTLQPWYIGDSRPQSAYFRRVEPEVVFGSIATGVPNRKRDDNLPDYDLPVQGVTSPGDEGLTFLDIVWDQAPFRSHGSFLATVAHTAADFVQRGLFSVKEKGTVVSAAARAGAELAPWRTGPEAGTRRMAPDS
jgi:DUF1680 family protein